MRKALITGITGQDGGHLTELLTRNGYKVFGLSRREPRREERHAFEWLTADLEDESSVVKALEVAQPDEIYNLASISFVPASWREPVRTAELMTVGITRLLEAVRQVCPNARFFQASSSEMFGKAQQTPQSEETPLRPRSPYGIAKAFGHQLTAAYRDSYGLFACSAILFNHEGPRRRLDFVTRKITHTAARIKVGLARELRLGNLQARRDWGFAGDYVRAMWLMLQQQQPDDFVIGTGETHTVEEFVEAAFAHLDLDWRRYVVIDSEFFRPAETELLCADARKARRVLGWKPGVAFCDLVRMMVDADLAALKAKGRPPKLRGFRRKAALVAGPHRPERFADIERSIGLPRKG